MKVITVELSKIEQNENSPVVYKASDLSELMHSMKKDGLLQPVGLRAIEGGKFDAVFGNRRIKAARSLGWSDIPAVILADVGMDQERDILGLIENMKRQNTTVAEDGRMFQALKDSGLKVTEIAARLDVSVVRIETALEVFNEIPKEYHWVILNRTTGKKITNTISASAAQAVLNVRKSHGLSKRQTKSLLDFAKEDDTSIQHLTKIAPLMKEGMNLKQAMLTAERLERFVVTVFIDRKKADKLEKSRGMRMGEILLRQLEKDSAIGIERQTKTGYFDQSNRTRYAARG